MLHCIRTSYHPGDIVWHIVDTRNAQYYLQTGQRYCISGIFGKFGNLGCDAHLQTL